MRTDRSHQICLNDSIEVLEGLIEALKLPMYSRVIEGNNERRGEVAGGFPCWPARRDLRVVLYTRISFEDAPDRGPENLE